MGDPRPTDQAIADLTSIVDDARRQADRVGYFAALYRQVTVAVRDAVDDGTFADGARMDLLAARLVDRYTEALAAWRAGGRCPRGWRTAFAAASRPARHVIVQHLVLGLNAHVNADLPVVCAVLAPGPAIDSLGPDVDAINELVARFTEAGPNTVGRFSPLLELLDEVGGRTDEQVLGFAVGRARADAWRHAVVLAHLPERLRDDAADLLDRRTAFLGRLIADPPFPVGPVLRDVAADESHDVAAVIDALAAL